MPSKENVSTKADWNKSQICKYRDGNSNPEYIVNKYDNKYAKMYDN